MAHKFEPPFIRSPYNYDMMAVSNETGLRCEDPSMAQQQFLEESDINTIVDRMGLNGEMPQSVRAPQFGDYTGISDYQEALNAVKAADSSFMQLPASLRARFDNDPNQFLHFVQDDANYEEARKLGILSVLEGPAAVLVPGKPTNADAPAQS